MAGGVRPQHPVPNAMTLAVRSRKPFIVVHTALIELLTPRELQSVLAHELGHLQAPLPPPLAGPTPPCRHTHLRAFQRHTCCFW